MEPAATVLRRGEVDAVTAAAGAVDAGDAVELGRADASYPAQRVVADAERGQFAHRLLARVQRGEVVEVGGRLRRVEQLLQQRERGVEIVKARSGHRLGVGATGPPARLAGRARQRATRP